VGGTEIEGDGSSKTWRFLLRATTTGAAGSLDLVAHVQGQKSRVITKLVVNPVSDVFVDLDPAVASRKSAV